jgi:hypothetical protein
MTEKTSLRDASFENLLPNSPVLASLIVISWLIFKPSAWRHYITSIDTHLSPDFALADLNSSHWQHPALRKLLYLGHGLWPLWSSMIVTLCLWMGDVPDETLLLVSCYALLFGVVGGLLGSLIVSLAFGIMGGAVGSILLSLPMGFEIDGYTFAQLDNILVFSMAENIAIAVMLSVSDLQIIFENTDPRAFWIVLFGIFTASQAGSVMYSTTKMAARHPQYRQIGSIVIGGFISGLAVFFLTGLMSILALSAARMQTGTLYVLAYEGLIVAVFGLSIAFIWGIQTRRWYQSLLLGLGSSFLLGLLTLLKNELPLFPQFKPLLLGLHGGMENAMLYMLLFAFPYILAKRIANRWTGIIAGILGSAGVYILFMWFMGHYSLLFILPLTLLALVLGLSFMWWRPLLFYPFQAAWNLLLYRAYEKQMIPQNNLLTWHAAFWDEHQHIPLYGLENHLVIVAERNPDEGKVAIEHLSRTSQQWAAKEAQIELDALQLQNCSHVNAISQAHRHLAAGELSGSASALLRSFSRISGDVKAALTQESHYNQRLALNAIEERLDGLLRELTRSSEPYALRFRPIAETWRQIIADYARTLSEAVESRQEIINPYVIGIPLTEHQEIFVGRSDISERIERLLLDARCPPLLLYGQRRTGKTSLLNNLGKLLPWQIIPLFVDLQGPTSLARDYAGFLYNISRTMLTSAKRHRELKLPTLTREHVKLDPFISFDEWLDDIEQHLEPNQTLLLILDEFSALEHVFKKGLLDEESVLGMFRHIIQHRPRIKILLSGSHTLDEFERWASYLINVQTVHISYLQANEALKLIENPVKDFALRYEESASRRVLELTRCHPALIQLICSEIVTLKNKQNINERRFAQVSDVDAAIPGALQHGRFFFADIANNQVTKTSLAMLQFLATYDEGQIANEETLRTHCPEEFEVTIANLRQRELVEQLGNGYCFQVELIRRWFINRKNPSIV